MPASGRVALRAEPHDQLPGAYRGRAEGAGELHLQVPRLVHTTAFKLSYSREKRSARQRWSLLFDFSMADGPADRGTACQIDR